MVPIKKNPLKIIFSLKLNKSNHLINYKNMGIDRVHTLRDDQMIGTNYIYHFTNQEFLLNVKKKIKNHKIILMIITLKFFVKFLIDIILVIILYKNNGSFKSKYFIIIDYFLLNKNEIKIVYSFGILLS